MKTSTKFHNPDLIDNFLQTRVYQKEKRIKRLARKENERRRRDAIQALKRNKSMEDVAWT